MSGERSTLTKARKVPSYARKLLRRSLIRQYRAIHFRLRPDHSSFDRTAALADCRRGDSLLFLCWGNVCRSPFAERYLRSRLAERGYGELTIDSAGLGTTEGRSSPEAAVETAAEYGVDLSDHRSKLASARLVQESDVVFVMDFNNFHSVVSEFPAAEENVYFFGPLAADRSSHVIGDPHGGVSIPTPNSDTIDRFEATYRSVADATDVLVDAIANDGRHR